jgi:hypothetical protein
MSHTVQLFNFALIAVNILYSCMGFDGQMQDVQLAAQNLSSV